MVISTAAPASVRCSSATSARCRSGRPPIGWCWRRRASRCCRAGRSLTTRSAKTGSDVELSLVAGAPQSFIQHISQPYYGRRAVVPMPSSMLLAPQTHQATLRRRRGNRHGTRRRSGVGDSRRDACRLASGFGRNGRDGQRRQRTNTRSTAPAGPTRFEFELSGFGSRTLRTGVTPGTPGPTGRDHVGRRVPGECDVSRRTGGSHASATRRRRRHRRAGLGRLAAPPPRRRGMPRRRGRAARNLETQRDGRSSSATCSSTGSRSRSRCGRTSRPWCRS